MHHHEKIAFFKFFGIYFVSVALLILAAGYFYFGQMKNHYLKMEEFSLIEYARHIKMGGNMDEYKTGFHHRFVTKKDQHIDIRNFTVTNDEFSKFIPMNHNKDYLQIFKSRQRYNTKLLDLKERIVFMQILLLLLFAYLSYKLAKSALQPLQKSIVTLDRFAKDLIHDLNTPITSINLNMKLLEKNPQFTEDKIINRLKRSVHNISELHENLNILLQEETFQLEKMNLCPLVKEVVHMQHELHKNIYFQLECSNFAVKINANAMKQILQNLISNACKYNVENGYVRIYKKGKSLYIEDSGKGIKEPEKIFQRSYSAEHSSGIGLDIVKRLALAMDITVHVRTSEEGSCFILTFT